MLNCVYHFNGDMQVVDDDAKGIMMASGAWFDHPNKAKEYKAELEKSIAEEEKAESLPVKRKAKKELQHEK